MADEDKNTGLEDAMAETLNEPTADVPAGDDDLNSLMKHFEEGAEWSEEPPADPEGSAESEESEEQEGGEEKPDESEEAESENDEDESEGSEDAKDDASDDEGDEDPPEGASKKASEDWKKLRGSRDKYKTQAAELEGKVKELEAKAAELEDLRGKAALSDELQEKLKNYDEMEKLVATLRVEESKEYKDAIAKPLSAIEQSAEALGKENEADIGAIFDALSEPDLTKQRIKLKEVTSGWDEIDKVELRSMANDARTLLAKQREARENALEAAKQREEMSAKEQAQQAEAKRKEFASATTHVIDQLKEKLPFVPLRDGETAEDRMAAVAQQLKDVDYDANSPNAKAFAAASALILPKAVQTIGKLQKEIEALETRLKKQNQSKPGAAPKEKPVENEDQDFLAAFG